MDHAARKPPSGRRPARGSGARPLAARAQQAVLEDRFAHLPGFSTAITVLLYASAFPEEIDTSRLIASVLTVVASSSYLGSSTDRTSGLYHVIGHRQGSRSNPGDSPSRAAIARQSSRAHRLGTRSGARVRWALSASRSRSGTLRQLLPTLRPEVLRWALIFDEQWCDDLPIESHDIPLDGVVSPTDGAATRVGNEAKDVLNPHRLNWPSARLPQSAAAHKPGKHRPSGQRRCRLHGGSPDIRSGSKLCLGQDVSARFLPTEIMPAKGVRRE